MAERTKQETGQATASGPFPQISKLGSLGQEAAAKLIVASSQLRLAGAPKAAARIYEIDGYIDRLEYSGLEARIDPDLTSDELAGAQQGKLRRAHQLRNMFALAPLLVTWLALGFAAWQYKDELAANKGDVTQPFLLLWERGFGHTGWYYPTFVRVAAFDVLLLLVVLALTWWVLRLEGREDVGRDRAMHALWEALTALKLAVDQSRPRPPATAEEWADAARRIIADAMEQTRLLAESSRTAIERASASLFGIQDQQREFIADFSGEVQRTLISVREQNEQFIKQAAQENRTTLQLLVEQQMEPLLRQLSTMLGEFGRHQETYRTAVAELTGGVNFIKGSAQELAESTRQYTAIGGTIAAAQDKVGAAMAESATSMAGSAAALTEVKAVLQSDLRDGVRVMAANVTAASGDLAAVERKLADTTVALDKVTTLLASAAADLRATVTGPVRRRPLWRRIFGL
jgi:hypothetical protein